MNIHRQIGLMLLEIDLVYANDDCRVITTSTPSLFRLHSSEIDLMQRYVMSFKLVINFDFSHDMLIFRELKKILKLLPRRKIHVFVF